MGRTVTDIHTAGGQAAQRCRTEARLRLALYRFFASAVMLRQACGLITTHGGAAGWWLTMLAMLPGVAVYGLAAAAMKRTGCSTLPRLAETLLGHTGKGIVMAVIALALVLEGAASMAALAMVFVDGVGTTVSAFLFAAAAAGVLCLCTERDGLVYGIGLLRWVLGLFGAVVLINAFMQAQMDHLFPAGGDGPVSWRQALQANWSIAWPLMLLLLEEVPAHESRRWVAPPVLVTAAAVALCLLLPHERLTQPRTLAERMLLPGTCLAPGSRVLLMCLWTAGLGMAAVIAAVRASDIAALPWQQAERWLPRILLGGFAAMMLLSMDSVWRVLAAVDTWLLTPFVIMVLVLAAAAFGRRKKA